MASDRYQINNNNNNNHSYNKYNDNRGSHRELFESNDFRNQKQNENEQKIEDNRQERYGFHWPKQDKPNPHYVYGQQNIHRHIHNQQQPQPQPPHPHSQPPPQAPSPRQPYQQPYPLRNYKDMTEEERFRRYKKKNISFCLLFVCV